MGIEVQSFLPQYRLLAQLVERQIEDLRVVGSIPAESIFVF